MPSNQKPKTASLQNNPAETPTNQNSSSGSPPPQTRRKTIDRRDTKDAESTSEQERRLKGNRRNVPASKQSKKGMTEQQRAADKKRQQNEMRVEQHRRKKMLAGCEPVMGMNYDSLAMDDYPGNALVAAAKRDRDYWVVMCGIFGGAFFLGLLDLAPAWVAGTGIGLFFLSLVFAFTSVRSSFFVRPPLRELLQKRKTIEFRALNHIHFLEGKAGLAWHCSKLAKYNKNLQRKLFAGLYRYSSEGNLFNVIKNKRHIRLYLLLMIESQKAYKRVQKAYLENHFKNIDQGWDDTVSDAEAEKLEQQLRQAELNDTQNEQNSDS